MRRRLTALFLALVILLSVAPVYSCFAAGIKTVYSKRELVEYVQGRTKNLQKQITFHYAGSVYSSDLTSSNISTLMYSCGASDFSWRQNSSAQTVTLNVNSYYTGFRVLHAYKQNKSLGKRETELLKKAQSIVKAAKKETNGNKLKMELYFHDYLVNNVTYTPHKGVNNGSHAQDNATGALLDHKAECDGYSDAFYLLCSLAGIKVGLQYGYIENGTHQWNTVMINGSWYFTDVTWDDVDYSSNKKMATYRYYHVGGNFLETHQWCADFSPCSVNPYMPWDEFPYTGKKKSGLDLGVYAGDVDSMCAWLASWRREGKKQCHVMIDGRYEYQSLINAYEKYCKKKKIRCGSFYLWANPMGNYTCVDVYFK